MSSSLPALQITEIGSLSFRCLVLIHPRKKENRSEDSKINICLVGRNKNCVQ